jgi:LmbE family N-acetylglucosaminyl deacetylase
MRFTRLVAVPVVLLCVLFVWAQAPRDVKVAPEVDATSLPIDRGAAALHQLLRKLHTRASLIMIVAHPDDEDGGMLAYETRGQGARATLLTLNRGEGGQNVMSDDYWDRLGEVRTQELLQADRYYGTQQYWTRVVDFGFAKTKEEALQKWGYNTVLYDVVRVVRMTRPLVVTSSFVGGPSDGHGHHQVAGMMAQEVFKAAADPKMFPDQIKEGLRPWKPLKVYARVPTYAVSSKGLYDYATGHYLPVRFYDYVADKWINGMLSTNVVIPEGNYDPVLGMTYLQIARKGLGFQKSQNGGVGFVPPSSFDSPYHRFGSAVPTTDHENSYFDGIDTSLMGIADLAKGGDSGFLKSGLGQINSLVEQATAKFDPMHPAGIAPLLAQGLQATRKLIDAVNQSSLSDDSKYDVNFELKVKATQFNDALADSLGVHLLATVTPEKTREGRFFGFSMGPTPTFDVAIPGQQFWVKVSVTDESTAPVQVANFEVKPSGKQEWTITPVGDKPGDLEDNKPASQKFDVVVPKDAGYTRPYFTRKNTEQSVYDINVPEDLNLPTSPYPLFAWATMNYNGVPFSVAKVVQSVNRDVGPGIVLNPMLVGPAISVSIDPHAGIVPLEGETFNVTATVHSNVKGEAKGTIKLDLPQGWTSSPADTDFDLAKDGEEQHVSFDITPRDLQEKEYDVTAVASYDGQQFTEGYQMTGYPGLRHYPYYRPAVYQTTGVNVKVAKNLNVGYVMGTGDDVPDSLKDLGINVHFLSSQDLASGDLSKYDVILLGIRAYAARADLITYNERLLDYVKNGGVVVVQYNTAQYDHDFGPYPYTLGNAEKVIDENSAVQILAPNNPALDWPNKITAADFNGWVEERGHGYMTTWDPHYQALLEMHDPGQAPQKGGLLYARYGKGVYVYVALALYRQLPEGVPGAYRITANLLSLGQNPELKSNSGQ